MMRDDIKKGSIYTKHARRKGTKSGSLIYIKNNFFNLKTLELQQQFQKSLNPHKIPINPLKRSKNKTILNPRLRGTRHRRKEKKKSSLGIDCSRHGDPDRSHSPSIVSLRWRRWEGKEQLRSQSHSIRHCWCFPVLDGDIVIFLSVYPERERDEKRES